MNAFQLIKISSCENLSGILREDLSVSLDWQVHARLRPVLTKYTCGSGAGGNESS